MEGIPWLTVLDLGLLLSIALAAGILLERVRIPHVTAFLLTGLALGPWGLGVLGHEDIVLFEPLGKAAMALVLFEMGCMFTLERIRANLDKVSRLSVGEITASAVTVFGGVLLLGYSLSIALMLGILAVATAPATTVLVLQEADSEGPVTDYTVSLVVFNNLACLILFELVLAGLLFWWGGADSAGSGVLWELVLFARDLAGSLLLGVAAGLLLTYVSALLDRSHWFVLLVAATVITLAISEHFHMPFLLTFLAMGATVANATEESTALVAEIKHLTGLLCVVFFTTHGAEMDPGALARAGLLGGAYVVLRLAGKYAGVWLASRWAGTDPHVGRWLGFTLLAQAGTALVLSSIAAERCAGVPGLEAYCQQVKTVILGTVVVFELIGPLLIRWAVLQAGEVPVAHAIRHVTTTPVEELTYMSRRILEALGLRKRQIAAADVPVKELMRKTFDAIPVTATFDEVVHLLEKSHQNTFPVVDANNHLVGIIRYTDLRDVLFDPELGSLVRADDIALPPVMALDPEERLKDIWGRIGAVHDDTIPVVKDGVLVGVLRPRDVFRLVVKAGKDTTGSAGSGVRAVERHISNQSVEQDADAPVDGRTSG